MPKEATSSLEGYPIRFQVQRGKVIIVLRKCQCTVDAEASMKIAHELMGVSEKALRKAGRIHEES